MKKLPDLTLKLSHTYKSHEIKHSLVPCVTAHSLGQEFKMLKKGETKSSKDINVIQNPPPLTKKY